MVELFLKKQKPEIGKSFVTTHLNPNKFIRPSGDPPITISIKDFVKRLESHEGLFLVDGKDYDNMLYCGTDNLYFSFCFNFNTGRAISENLLIVDSILEYNSQFVIISQGKEYSVSLKG